GGWNFYQYPLNPVINVDPQGLVDINSARSKVMLTPIGWETHTSPELGVRPQELINQRLLVDCDLLIGVFWT
ncbi:hypothetical protein ACR8KK_02545, partial [Shigella boydii]